MPSVMLRGVVRWWHLGAVTVLALGAVVVPAVLGPLFITPQMTAVDVVVLGPTAILSGVLGSFAVSVTLREPVTVLPWTGPRDIRRWRLIRVGVILGLVTTLAGVSSGQGVGAVVVCLFALAGEALLTGAFLWEEIAWTVPLLHAGMTLTFGVDVFGDPHPWAWILHPEPEQGHVILSVMLLVGGALCWAYRRPRP